MPRVYPDQKAFRSKWPLYSGTGLLAAFGLAASFHSLSPAENPAPVSASRADIKAVTKFTPSPAFVSASSPAITPETMTVEMFQNPVPADTDDDDQDSRNRKQKKMLGLLIEASITPPGFHRMSLLQDMCELEYSQKNLVPAIDKKVVCQEAANEARSHIYRVQSQLAQGSSDFVRTLDLLDDEFQALYVVAHFDQAITNPDQIKLEFGVSRSDLDDQMHAVAATHINDPEFLKAYDEAWKEWRTRLDTDLPFTDTERNKYYWLDFIARERDRLTDSNSSMNLFKMATWHNDYLESRPSPSP